MNKQELAKQYADKKVDERKEYPLYDLSKRKELTTFDGYDIEQAYEDGFDKAVELAMGWLKNNAERYVYWMDEEFGNKDLLDDFKKYMEGKDEMRKV